MTDMRILRRIIHGLLLSIPFGMAMSLSFLKGESEFTSVYLATKPEYHFLLEDLEKNGQARESAQKYFSPNQNNHDWYQKDGRVLSELLALKLDSDLWTTAQIRDFAQYLLIASQRHQVDPALLLSLIDVESEFRPSATSPRGAIGLMQVKPTTASAFLGEKVTEEVLYDPKKNIEVGLGYLVELRRRFKKPEFYLTAYNIGPSELMRRLQNKEELPMQYYQKILRKMPTYKKPQEKIVAGQWNLPWL